MAVVYTVTQWPATRALIGDPRLDDPKFNTRAGRRKNIAELYAALAPWFAGKTREEIQKTAQAKGVPFGPIFSPAELLADRAIRGAWLPRRHDPSDRGKLRLPQLPVQWNGRSFAPRPAPADDAPPSRMPRHLPVHGRRARPLAGVRVLDFGLLTAGANTSAMLADLGADVIKIESGAYLDPFRVVGKIDNDDGWWNRSPQFRFTNRNKRGLALNLKDPEGQRVIRELAAHCDVVVENFRRGVLDRAGLGYKDLSAINPRLVFAAISSQGDTGPGAHERLVRQHARRHVGHRLAHRLRGRGAAHLGHGRELSRPDRVAVRHGHRDRRRHRSAPHRQGCIPRLLPARGRVVHPRRGNPGGLGRSKPPSGAARQYEAGVALQDSYKCADGEWLAVTLDAPDASMEAFCAGKDRDAALAALLAKGIAAAPCLDGNDLLRDTALQGVTLVRDENGGLVKGLPYRLDGKGLAIERPAPDLGQHTDEVLRELLGYDDARLKQLNDSGVTSTTPTIGEV